MEPCRTCGLTDPTHHPCDATGMLYPCPDDFHREPRILRCDEPDCDALGLTRKATWRCAIHHHEHPMNRRA